MNKTTVAQPAKTSSFIPPVQGILQRKCSCGNHTVAGGECTECAKKKTGLQHKLTIGASNDPLEQEADRVANQVMAMPLNSAVKHTIPRIQRFSGQVSHGLNTAPPSVNRVLASSGRPLEPVLRQDMEQRFGHDFSQVQVYTGGTAEQSAREVNAHAYTVGNNIVFGAERFVPSSGEGKKLIAHELTHVVQQNWHSCGLQKQSAESIPATVYICSKDLDTSPIGKHAFFRIGRPEKGNTTYSLQPVNQHLFDPNDPDRGERGKNGDNEEKYGVGCWQGVPDINWSSDLNAAGVCEATALSLNSLINAHNSYPIGHYCTLGPNSNTYVGHIARICGMTNVDPPGWTPGIDDSPPPNGTFAPSRKYTLIAGCVTKECGHAS